MKKDKGITTSALARRPQITDNQEFYYHAFHYLSETRMDGWSIRPITFVDILAYVTLHGITSPEVRERLTRLVRSLDKEFTLFKAKPTKVTAPPPTP